VVPPGAELKSPGDDEEETVATLDSLAPFLNELMGAAGEKDPYVPSGPHVRGREQVKLLATGVSASPRLFEEAVSRGSAGALPRYVDHSTIAAAWR